MSAGLKRVLVEHVALGDDADRRLAVSHHQRSRPQLEHRHRRAEDGVLGGTVLDVRQPLHDVEDRQEGPALVRRRRPSKGLGGERTTQRQGHGSEAHGGSKGGV